MLIVNATDAEIRGRFSVEPPRVTGGEETYIMAKVFIFPPREVVEVEERAGQHLLGIFGPKGLMQYRLGEDLDELVARGRRQWHRHLDRMIADHEQQNNTRLAQGLPALIAGEHLYEARTQRDKLAREFGEDFMHAARPMGGQAPVLTPEQQHAANARRASKAEIEEAQEATS